MRNLVEDLIALLCVVVLPIVLVLAGLLIS